MSQHREGYESAKILYAERRVKMGISSLFKNSLGNRLLHDYPLQSNNAYLFNLDIIIYDRGPRGSGRNFNIIFKESQKSYKWLTGNSIRRRLTAKNKQTEAESRDRES